MCLKIYHGGTENTEKDFAVESSCYPLDGKGIPKIFQMEPAIDLGCMLRGVRAPRVLLIVGGVVALGVGVVWLLPPPGRVSVHVLGETNGYGRFVIRNNTPQLYSVLAWGEFYRNDAWERLSLSNTFHMVEPGSFVEAQVPMPTNRPRRLALVQKPIRTSPPAVWVNALKARLRLKPEVEHVYVGVE